MKEHQQDITAVPYFMESARFMILRLIRDFKDQIRGQNLIFISEGQNFTP